MSKKQLQETLDFKMEDGTFKQLKTMKFHNIAAGGIKRTIEKSIKDPSDSKKIDLLKELDITAVNEKGQKINLFFGELALDGNRPSYIWSDNRVNDIRSRVAIYTSLALMTEKDEATFVAMTGLPLLHLATLKSEYEENLPGTMEITFNSGPWEGKTKKITIIKARATAQSYGIYMNEVLDLNGKPIRPELTKGHVGIIDTGFRTTNLLYIRDGEPKDIGSEQTEDGMNVVHTNIKQFIESQGGIINIEEVERVYNSNKYEISNGDIIDFEFPKSIALDDLSNRIAQTANRLWTIENMKSVIVGGGGGAAIYDNLKYKQKHLGDNCQFANAIGYLKSAIRILQKTDQFSGQDIIPVGIDSGFGYMKIAVLM